MNISYSEAISDRNTFLFRFARDHGRLPLDFPVVYLDSYGCVLLHRWMIRTYYGIQVSYSSITAEEIRLSDNRELDVSANLEPPRFEELLVLTRSIYLADSEGPIRPFIGFVSILRHVRTSPSVAFAWHLDREHR